MKRLAVAALVLAGCGKPGDAGPAPAGMPAKPAVSADRAKDPICQMMVDKATAAAKATHEGATYYFCAETCLKEFQANPKKFAVACACARAGKKCGCEHCGVKDAECDCRK